MKQIYLDNNSTTPIDPDVFEVMTSCYELGYANPASQHRTGQAARRKLEQLRTEIVGMLGGQTSGMDADRLIFTSGGTESNNLAVLGLAHLPEGDLPVEKQVLVSSIEHPSVIGAGQQLARLGFQVRQIPVDKNGVVDIGEVQRLLEKPTRLVSVMMANNETGVIQPVAQIASLCREKGVMMHTDAVQAVGKIPVSFGELGVDALSLTAHKLHGPRGIGGLLLKHTATPSPIVFGGFQQMAIRPGTEDVALVAGMHKAVSLYSEAQCCRLRELRNELQCSIRSAFPDVVVNGELAERTPHTLNLSFPGVNRQALLMASDIAGLAISTGSACASGSSEPSPVLVAMGADSDVVEGSIRISLGRQNTAAEINLAAERIIKLISDLRPQKTTP